MLRSIGVIVVCFLSAGSVAAAERSNAPPKGLDWGGVWQHLSGVKLDPKTGAPTMPRMVPPPLKPEFQKRLQDTLRAAKEGRPIGDGAECKWPGVPMIIRTTMPQEFIVLPDRVIILYEYQSQIRRIFTDGRKAPGPDDLDYTFNGFSTGYWEGDTLVVETVGLRDDTLLFPGVGHTEQLKVIERYREVSPGLIEVDITMTDPGTLTAPWNSKGKFRRQAPDFPILEYNCHDNNRERVDDEGVTVTLGPDGKPL